MLNPVKYSINISSSCSSPGTVGRIPYAGQHGREFLTSGIYSAAPREAKCKQCVCQYLSLNFTACISKHRIKKSQGLLCHKTPESQKALMQENFQITDIS